MLLTVPPMASEPKSTEAGPLTTSMRAIEKRSTVEVYWFGPERQVELLSRMPSIRKSVRKPVKPRM